MAYKKRFEPRVIKFEAVSLWDGPENPYDITVEATKLDQTGFWEISSDFTDDRLYGDVNQMLTQTKKKLRLKDTLKQIKESIKKNQLLNQPI